MPDFVPADCQNLIEHMLVVEPDQRYTVRNAVQINFPIFSYA